MLRKMLWALALVTVLSLLVPACGSDEGCLDGTYRCLISEGQYCQDQQWHTLVNCNQLTTCCMINGYPICAVHCF